MFLKKDIRVFLCQPQWKPVAWGMLMLALLTAGVSRLARPAVVYSAATPPSGFVDEQIVSGLSSPSAMAIAPDGRIFVCEQGGALRVIKNGALLSTPFLTVPVSFQGERGLLGLAFDPGFESNQYVYVYYTTSSSPIRNRISRFTANGDVAATGSEVVVMELSNLSSATNHNGGALHFGPDGKLYAAVGDNASGSNAQTLVNLHGKMLRINSDGSIPTDNPFYNQATGNNRAIWTLGLRNPFTFAFQSGTGRMFINDVGQSTAEEINDGIAGSNYGWPACEGPCNPTNPNYRDPLFRYLHSNGGCAITGGVFYNPATNSFPAAYTGKYFYVDYCAAWIRLLDPATQTATTFATLDGGEFVVDLDVNAQGELLYLQRGNGGQVRRIRYTASQAPAISQHPASVTVPAGTPATFTVAATGSGTLTYQWQRNGNPIANANSPSYTLSSPSLGDSGARFRCVVTSGFGAATSNEATLTVVTNQPPVAAITLPTVNTTYRAGTTISYAGTGTDPETGALPGSAFTWTVDFHHDTHTHPHVLPTSGSTSGTFFIPTVGETEANVWFRVYLTVTDPLGQTHTVFRDIYPQISTITLRTTPPGMQLTLDGVPVTTPFSVQSVVGVTRLLGAVSPQTVSGTTYEFAGWSDGGAAVHEISTPVSNTTFTATFRPFSVSAKRSDFDGDGKADFALWRSQAGLWSILRSSNNATQSTAWGAGTAPHNDLPVPGDYDGDGKVDLAVWRPLDGYWYILRSSDAQVQAISWGSGSAPFNDIPVPGDYDGDGRTDAAVLRPGTGYWYVLRSTDGEIDSFTLGGAVASDQAPVQGDYDGDGRTDVALWRRSTGAWSILRSSDGQSQSTAWGSGIAPHNDLAVPADYDGDGKFDLAVWRRANGFWHILQSSNGQIRSVSWGSNADPFNDVPAPGDYDGDGKDDIGVWRPQPGAWYVIRSSNGSILARTIGVAGDVPIASVQR